MCLYFICISQALTWPCSLLQWQRCAGRRAAEADRGSDWEFPGACQERADLALCLEPRRHRGPRSRTSLISVSVCFKLLQSCSLKKEAFFCQAFHRTAIRRGGQRKGYNLLLQFSVLLTKSLINPHQMNCPSTFEAAELSCYILSKAQFRYPQHLFLVCEHKVLKEWSLQTNKGCFFPAALRPSAPPKASKQSSAVLV